VAGRDERAPKLGPEVADRGRGLLQVPGALLLHVSPEVAQSIRVVELG
jgi:hypothetical protein